MPDPWNAFQAATAVFSLAAFTGKLIIKYTDRIRQAPEFIKDVTLKLAQAQRMLDNTGKALQTYARHAQQSGMLPSRLDFGLDVFLKDIGVILEELLAYVEPLNDGQLSARDRAKLAFSKQDDIAYQLGRLDTLCNILRDTLPFLNFQVAINHGRDMHRRREELQGHFTNQLQRRDNLRHSLLVNDQFGPSSEQDVKAFEGWLNKVQTVCNDMLSQYGPEWQLSSMFIVENNTPIPPPVYRLENLLSEYQQQAQMELNNEHWQEAESNLLSALPYYNECAKQQPMSLQQLFDLTNNLAVAYRKQQKWIASIQECRRLLEFVSRPELHYSDQPSEHLRQVLKASASQTLACVYFERHQQCEESNDNLEEARRWAEQAWNIRDSPVNVKDRNEADIELQNSCLYMLIDIYHELGLMNEAEGARKALSDASIAMSARRAELTEASLSVAGSTSVLDQQGSLPHNADGNTLIELVQAVQSGSRQALLPFMRYRGLKDLIEQQVDGKTPLIHAITIPKPRVGIINQLLRSEWKANPNTRIKDDATALHFAAELNLVGIGEILIKSHADKEANMKVKLEGDSEFESSEKQTPLMRAMKLDHHEFVRMLRRYRAKIDVRFEDMSSLLHWAVRNCSPLALRTLLETDTTGYLVTRKDSQNHTALHLCANMLPLKTEHAKEISKHCPRAINLDDSPEQPAEAALETCSTASSTGRTALYFIVSKPAVTERVEFAKALHDIDPSAIEQCQNAAKYTTYKQRLQPGTKQRRDSGALLASSEASSSEAAHSSAWYKKPFSARKSSTASKGR